MIRSLLFLATASSLGVATLGVTDLQAQFPTAPPAPMPLEPGRFPPFAESVLSNGLRVIVVANDKQPVLSMSLSVPGGSFYDPFGKTGTSEFVAGLLTKGAGNRSAEQIAATIEGVGGSLTASSGADFLSVNAAVLNGETRLAFELLADAALRPTFPQQELELYRQQSLSALTLAKSQPEQIAARAFARGLFGEHPYGRSVEENTLKAITRDDLVAFHTARMRPNQALLVIAGAIDTTGARILAEQTFGSWTGVAAGTPATRPAPQRARTEITIVHRAGSVQSNILAGNTTWMATDTRSYALSVANQVLGGASDSRLFQILREEKGWTYGAYSSVARRRGLGSFTASADVRTEVTDSALVELLAQLRRVGSQPIPADEFERAKLTLTGRFPLQTETADAVAAQVATARVLGLATDYVQTYRQRIASVTAEQALAAARQGVRADGSLVVVVGDATKIAGPLAAIAPVNIVTVDGAPMKLDDLTVKELTLDIDAARLVPAADSFQVMFQGSVPLGFQSAALTRDGDGWLYKERSQLATVVQQESAVRFSATLEMRGTKQTGKFQGQDFGLDITYADGSASGTGKTPSGTGAMQDVKYSGVAVPAGAVDDNVLQALLPYMKWENGASITVNVFATGKGIIETRNLKVMGTETVTVPMGTVETYRIAMTGGEAPGTFWVEVAPAHRVIKFGPTGQPIEFLRVR
ncbi:MAG: insulinase family protein [Gemmatimonadaceae bacterium]|nr:insulinase family protein [Gemmatimonadaceae bacterium]